MSIESVFGPDGRLARLFDRYEDRPQQVEMARGVERAFKERKLLIVEAATGTGKTLAYLVPAIQSGKRVVVSTGTKALQEQLFQKDLPFLREVLPEKFDAVLLKGRRNYLCKLRLEEMQRKPVFRSTEDFRLWPEIQRWAQETETGDRAEIHGMPDSYPTWHELSVGAESCIGSKCKFWEECFVQKARKEAQEADLIVVNHHLFFADLALRQKGMGEILPEYDGVIFDEAHHLEQVATDYFGYQVSNYRLDEIGGDIERAIADEGIDGGTAGKTLEAISAMVEAEESFFDLFRKVIKSGRVSLEEVYGQVGEEVIEEAYRRVMKTMEKLEGEVRALPLGEIGERLGDRTKEIGQELGFLLHAEDLKYAYMVERRDRGVFLQALPIDLAGELRRKLLDTHDTLVFTSATLATGGDFSYFRRRLGMNFEAFEGEELVIEELLLPSVFDYENQCVLYVPRKLPAPHDREFCANVALITEYLVNITEGRAFVLFTSYQNMRDVYERLADKLAYPMLMQGEKGKRELLEEFRTTAGAVLFATSSFWEGVDVEGEALSLVIMDKLPFANPSDPLMRARFDLVEARGGSPFGEISLPEAAIALRQGFGRLIRSAEDRGVVAVLDSRIAHKSYGRYFLRSLPEAPVVWTAPGVKRWWLQGNQ